MIAPDRTRLRRASRALTLLEIVVSSAILAALMLTLSAALLPMQRATNESHAGLDMDRDARRVMAELRRTLRQSGLTANGGYMIAHGASELPTATAPGDVVTPVVNQATTLLTLRQRLNYFEVVETSEEPPTALTDLGPTDYRNWGRPIALQALHRGTFSGTPDTVQRYALARWQSVNADGTYETDRRVVLVENVSEVSIEVDPAGGSVTVVLELTRPATQRTGATALAPLTRRFVETIELLNKPED